MPVDKPALPDPLLITQPDQVKLLLQSLSREPIIAVDTESNGLHAYQEQVCLIQFSTPDSDYLVDPLALDDLSPLAPIFKNKKIEKVFHAAEYDLICLKRDFGFEFANLFDTMIVARILGHKSVGLGSMLKAEFGVQLNKRYQRANWGKRPLSAQLLAYARMDTRYLIPLRNRLKESLKESKRWKVAVEDFKRLTQVAPPREDPKTKSCWRVNGVYDLEPQRVAVLEELCQYRDQAAKKMDRPVFKVIGNSTLVAIAERAPTRTEELANIAGMTKRQIKRHANGILDAVKNGMQAEPIQRPVTHRPDDQYLHRIDALRQWRKATASKMDVDSDIVLPKDMLFTIAKAWPTNEHELEEIMADLPWRYSQFADSILDVIHDKR